MYDLEEEAIKAKRIITGYLDYRDRLDTCMKNINKYCEDVIYTKNPRSLMWAKTELVEALKMMKRTCDEIRGQIKYENNEEIDRISKRIDNNLDDIVHMCNKIGRNIDNISNFRALQNNQLEEMQLLTTKIVRDIDHIGIEIINEVKKGARKHFEEKNEKSKDDDDDRQNHEDNEKDKTSEEVETEKNNLILDTDHIPGYIHQITEYITKGGKIDTKNYVTRRLLGSTKILCQKATEDIAKRFDLKNNSNAIALIELYDELSRFCDQANDVELLYKFDEEIDKKTKILEAIEKGRFDEKEETHISESQEIEEVQPEIQESDEIEVEATESFETDISEDEKEEANILEGQEAEEADLNEAEAVNVEHSKTNVNSMENTEQEVKNSNSRLIIHMGDTKYPPRTNISGSELTKQAVKNLDSRLIINVGNVIYNMERSAERENTTKESGNIPSGR